MENKSKVIAVVDDDSGNLTLIHGILGAFYKVYAVDSGEDALELFSIHRPDLILLDVEMPGMSGAQLFDKIKANQKWRDIPVIFLTGHSDTKSEADAFSCGAADFIRKPVNDVIMLARVKMHLEYDMLRKQARELAGRKD